MPTDRPGVIAPPPLIFVVPLIAGIVLQRSYHQAAAVGGALLIVAGGALAAWAIVSFARAKTTVNPYGSASTLVTNGPYRLSRNPMYVALAMIYAGIALLFASWAAMAMLPLAIATVHFGVIRKEEAYLERKFGDAYRVLERTTRRWL